MGEMADDFLEDVLDMEDKRQAARHGELTFEEMQDQGLIAEDGSEDF